jgi:hypothetical protein
MDESDDIPVDDGSGVSDDYRQVGDIYFVPPRHLLPWSKSEEEDDAQEELVLCKNQQMWDKKYSTYLHHFGYDPIEHGVSAEKVRMLGFSSHYFLFFFIVVLSSIEG